MKSNVFNILLLAVMGTTFSACQDSLHEPDFTYSIANSTFYNTSTEANAAVLAPLDVMRGAYDANWFATLELNTEYCYPKGVYTGYNHTGTINATHETRLASNWASIFKAISFCNMAIERLPKANAMTEAEIASYLGELRFLRAINYFNIVRHWGSVPLRTDVNLGEWDLGKTSVNDIYAFIVADLKFAITNTPDTPRIIGTPGKNAAKALLAEVFMYTENYAEAKTLAQEVISSKSYALVNIASARDFDKVFGYDLVTSTEEVFYIKTSRTDSKTWDYLSYTSHPQYQIEPGKRMLNGFGYFTHFTDLRNKVIANWDQKDFRYGRNLGFYVFGADAYGSFTCLLTKYWDPNSSGGGANVSIPLIRYTDVLLTYAEASVRVAGGPTPESIEILNNLRRRGYGNAPDQVNQTLDYKLADYNTTEKFIDLLIKEERYERINEGKHWDFITRLKKEKDLIGQFKKVNGEFTEITQRHYLWKIPDSEFNYNKGLDQAKDQNPGY